MNEAVSEEKYSVGKEGKADAHSHAQLFALWQMLLPTGLIQQIPKLCHNILSNLMIYVGVLIAILVGCRLDTPGRRNSG